MVVAGKLEKLINNLRVAEEMVDNAKKKLGNYIIENKIDFSDFEPDEYFYEKPVLGLEVLSGGELALYDELGNMNYIDAFINHRGKITYAYYKEHFMTGML